MDNLFWLRFAMGFLCWMVICPLANLNKIIWEIRIAKRMDGAPNWRWMAQYLVVGALVVGALYASLRLILPLWATAVGTFAGLMLTLILTYDRWMPFSSFRIRVRTGTVSDAMERASAALRGEATRHVRIQVWQRSKTTTKTTIQEAA